MLITILVYFLPISFSNCTIQNEVIQLIFQNLSIYLYFIYNNESGIRQWFEWLVSVHNLLHNNNYCVEFKSFNLNLTNLAVSCKKLLPFFSLNISESIFDKYSSTPNWTDRDYFMLNVTKLLSCCYCVPLVWSEELNEEIEAATDDKWTSGSNLRACDRDIRIESTYIRDFIIIII